MLVATMWSHRHDAGTFSRKDGSPVSPRKGYAVGGIVKTLQLDANVSKEDYEAKVGLYLSILPDHVQFVGTWYHEGTIHIDATNIIANKENALMVARRRKEIAIFDFATMEEIFV
jgi:ATP adenylyltransferase/5',5'''-P-1,P-4-tetraphosphate phosphorylase II